MLNLWTGFIKDILIIEAISCSLLKWCGDLQPLILEKKPGKSSASLKVMTGTPSVSCSNEINLSLMKTLFEENPNSPGILKFLEYLELILHQRR